MMDNCGSEKLDDRNQNNMNEGKITGLDHEG